jgi:ribosomal protein S12 methylthiotransferase accessory factor
MHGPSSRSSGNQEPVKKGFTTGTHRIRSPEETFADYKRWMPSMGITRIANLTGLDVIGLPVYTAVRPNARSLSTSQGKGIDDASAKTSALMESIEFWHAEHIDEASLRWDTYARMRRSARTVDLGRLATWGPVPADVPMLWIKGLCLLAREPIWVPFDVVSLADLTVAGVPLSPFWATTTGLASGNHKLEAIAHALCEIVERHCEAAWVEAEGSTRIDPTTVSQGVSARVLSRLRDAGVWVSLWDCTDSVIGVPTYICEILDPPDSGRRRLLGAYNGSGTHLSSEIALARAITEAVQSRLTFVAGSRDDFFRAQYGSTQNEAVHRLKWADLLAGRDLFPFEPRSLATDTFEEDVERLLSAVVKGGSEQVIVVDLTRSDVQIPVVKVIVPGMTEFGAPPIGGEKHA